LAITTGASAARILFAVVFFVKGASRVTNLRNIIVWIVVDNHKIVATTRRIRVRASVRARMKNKPPALETSTFAPFKIRVAIAKDIMFISGGRLEFSSL
jgi:hypothetical protein